MPSRRNGVQRRSARQEQRGADRLGGRRTPGSGAGWVKKNDVYTDDLSLEYKFTDKKSYSLKADELEKAQKHALMDSGREAGFVVELNGKEYVVVSRPYFESLYRGHSEQS